MEYMHNNFIKEINSIEGNFYERIFENLIHRLYHTDRWVLVATAHSHITLLYVVMFNRFIINSSSVIN